MRSSIAISIAVLSLAAASSAVAQNQPTPEQRIQRLENQLRQVQGRVFVRGQPADTAGFVYEPAATQSSVTAVNDRLAALERQMADILRLSEENGNRLASMETAVGRLRTDQEARLTTLERRIAEAPTVSVGQPSIAPGTATSPAKPPSITTATTTPKSNGPSPAAPATATPADDPGEAVYSEGFRLWEAGKYAEAIASLRGFTAVYPQHRRVSFANNLIGRSLLDSGQSREAAEALLTNYRSNPRGERAPDSLYYLGQALMKLGQPGQACKAYAELEDVYGGKIRADLAKLIPPAKSQAACS